MTFIDVIAPYYPQLLSAALTISVSALNYIFRPKVALVWNDRAFFTQNLPTTQDKSQYVRVNSKSITFANLGRASAKSIEIVFNYEPDAFSIWPQRLYEVKKNPEGKLIIMLNNLAPKEEFFIDLTCVNRDIPLFLMLRGEDANGKDYNSLFRIKNRPLINFITKSFSFIGVFSITLLIVKLWY